MHLDLGAAQFTGLQRFDHRDPAGYISADNEENRIGPDTDPAKLLLENLWDELESIISMRCGACRPANPCSRKG